MANWKRSVMGAILLAVILLLTLFFGAIVGYENSKKEFLGALPDGQGGYLEVANPITSITEGNTSRLVGVKDTIAVKQGTGSVQIKRDEKTVSENSRLLSYPEQIYQNFEPLVVEGKWLDAIGAEELADGTVPVVVTADRYQLKVGETFSMRDSEVLYRVIGVIRDGADVFWAGNSYSYINKDYRAFYEDAFFERNGFFIMMVREQDAPIEGMVDGSKTIVLFEDDYTEEQRRQNEAVYAEIGHFVALEDFAANSEAEYHKLLITYIPIGAMVLMVVCITLLAMAIVDYRSSLDFLGVYYLCGMSRADYLKMLLVDRGLVSLTALLVVNGIYWCVRAVSGMTVYTRVYSSTLCVMLGLLLVVNIVYMVAACAAFFKNSPLDSVKKKGYMV